MYNYITIGHDCSPAAALRNLNIREEALPFDWVISNIFSLYKCFETNFVNYHTNLKFNYNKTRLIDEYGFQFPHDYPLMDNSNNNVNDIVGEGIIGEEKNKHITDNWKAYYNIVKEKYNRRIERFLKIVRDHKPIIILSRYNTSDVINLRQLITKFYNKQNIYFINSSNEKFENMYIKNCYTEENNIWNDPEIWKKNINHYIHK